MIRTVILEDRPAHRDQLLEQLSAWPRADGLELRCAATAEELEDLLRREPADLLLADIDLGKGKSTGIQLVQQLLSEESGTQVIYITGYPLQFCTTVYQTEHIYFLTKPLRQQELFDALDRAMEKLAKRIHRTVAIRTGGRILTLAAAQIHYVESDRRLARLHTAEGTVETYLSLSQLLPQLGPAFVQCHKSFLVNMAQVFRMEPDCLHLKNGSRAPISQAYRKKTRDAYLDFLARRL